MTVARSEHSPLQPETRRPTTCTCGHHRSSSTTTEDGLCLLSNMEASFVHLPSTEGFTLGTTLNHQDGFLWTYQHVNRMIRAADGPHDAALCVDCVHRVMKALQDDIHRIQAETVAYDAAVVEEEERYQSLRKAVSSNLVPPGEVTMNLIEWTQKSFRDEIDELMEACRLHKEELEQLRQGQREQFLISKQLDMLEDSMAQEQNTLELEARAFDNDMAQVSYQIRKVHDEMDSLASVRLHSALFELVVDKRGLRYPLINDLRLACRPKGDVQWAEINAAWSQVSTFLLLVGTSVGFRPKNWRIVPLTSCAKLMYLESNRREVYTMGGKDGGRDHMPSSLRALTALLDPLVQHIAKLLPECSTVIPYDMSRNRIGSWDLSRIEDGDDSGWSNVIQCISLNLRWVQDRASDWETIRLLDASFTS